MTQRLHGTRSGLHNIHTAPREGARVWGVVDEAGRIVYIAASVLAHATLRQAAQALQYLNPLGAALQTAARAHQFPFCQSDRSVERMTA